MKDERRRVVITGTGLVTPLGTGVEKNWNALCEGRSGIGPITRFDVSDFPTPEHPPTHKRTIRHTYSLIALSIFSPR